VLYGAAVNLANYKGDEKNMKKLITSKPFIAGALAVFCIVTLTLCLLWRNDKHEFVPDNPVPLGSIDSWTENSSPSDVATENDENNQVWQPPNSQPWPPPVEQIEEASGDYPIVVEENRKDEVVIVFTDPTSSKEPPPEIPNREAVSGHSGHSAPDTPGSSEQPRVNNNTNNPVPGSMNDRGEFYDPAFGWVRPGQVEQIEIDSDGDPNKMVGTMD